MNSVAFLQQQIDEVSLQISQLISKRAKLFAELQFAQEFSLLEKYNLKNKDDSGTMVIPAKET